MFGRLQNWLCGIYASLVSIPIYMLGALWGMPYLMHVNHMPATGAAMVLGMLFVGNIVGSPLYGWLSDAICKRKVLMIIGAVLTLVVSIYLMMVHSNDVALFSFIFFILGVVSSSEVLAYPMVAESNPKTVSSMAISTISIMTLSGGVFSEPLFGFVLSSGKAPVLSQGEYIYSSAQYEHAIMLLPIIVIIGLLVSLCIKETYNKEK